MKIRSYAKINETLKIGRKQKNGLHSIESIVHKIDLCDVLEFKVTTGKISMICSDKTISSENNLAFKAAKLLKEKFHVKKGIEIKITKRIPVFAGLGGGSSNAGSTLIALNEIWKLNLSKKQLMKLGAGLGSDVSLFLEKGSVIVTGTGDKIKKIKSKKRAVLLIKPSGKISTSWAYENFKRGKDPNDFASLAIETIPEIAAIISELKEKGATFVSITGKGPTVFAFFKDDRIAWKVFKKMKSKYPFVVLTKTNP